MVSFLFLQFIKKITQKGLIFFGNYDIIKKFDIWGVLCYNYVVKIVVNEKGGK